MGPFKITGAFTATALNPLRAGPGDSSCNFRHRRGKRVEQYRKILPLALAKHTKP
jgi:hypothetical protein